MVKFGYDYIEAKNEKDALDKLVRLQVQTGYTYKIINIYPNNKKIIIWYYTDRRDK